MRSEGDVSRSVCLSACVSTLILALQATRRPIGDTSGFRTTRAGKLKAISLKRLRLRDTIGVSTSRETPPFPARHAFVSVLDLDLQSDPRTANQRHLHP